MTVSSGGSCQTSPHLLKQQHCAFMVFCVSKANLGHKGWGLISAIHDGSNYSLHCHCVWPIACTTKGVCPTLPFRPLVTPLVEEEKGRGQLGQSHLELPHVASSFSFCGTPHSNRKLLWENPPSLSQHMAWHSHSAYVTSLSWLYFTQPTCVW